MIAENEMMELLLEACPSFRPTWEVLFGEQKKSATELFPGVVTVSFGRHLTRMFNRCDTKHFPDIFSAVERLFVEGDAPAQACAFGLLEELREISNVGRPTEPDRFRQFLGPYSADKWDDLIRYWHLVEAHFPCKARQSRSGDVLPVDPDSIQDPRLRRLARALCQSGRPANRSPEAEI